MHTETGDSYSHPFWRRSHQKAKRGQRQAPHPDMVHHAASARPPSHRPHPHRTSTAPATVPHPINRQPQRPDTHRKEPARPIPVDTRAPHIFPTICPISWTSPPSRPTPHPVSTPEGRIQVSPPTLPFPERTRPTPPQSLRTLSVNCVLAGDTQLLCVKAATQSVIHVLSTDILPVHVL